jgi:hypothetical protein
MAYVGYTGVANQANTSDGFALQVSAANVPGATPGDDVGDDGVVDRYGASNGLTFYIADEGAPGYVLQESGDKIVLESS